METGLPAARRRWRGALVARWRRPQRRPGALVCRGAGGAGGKPAAKVHSARRPLPAFEVRSWGTAPRSNTFLPKSSRIGSGLGCVDRAHERSVCRGTRRDFFEAVKTGDRVVLDGIPVRPGGGEDALSRRPSRSASVPWKAARPDPRRPRPPRAPADRRARPRGDCRATARRGRGWQAGRSMWKSLTTTADHVVPVVRKTCGRVVHTGCSVDVL